jgi:hypothetical protein
MQLNGYVTPMWVDSISIHSIPEALGTLLHLHTGSLFAIVYHSFLHFRFSIWHMIAGTSTNLNSVVMDWVST